MDVVYSKKEASVTDVVDSLSDAPSRTSVRTLLGIMVEKGFLKYRKIGREYIYKPTKSKKIGGSGCNQACR